MIAPQFTKSWGIKMKKEFMSVARKIGRYLGVAALSFSLIACGGEADAASNNSTSTPTAQTTQEKSLPFPSFPASFEAAYFNGKYGCIPDDARYQFAVMKNEGLVLAGMHPLMETAQTGVHIMNFLYHPDKNYGYTLAFRNEGTQCVYNKVTDVKFKSELTNVFSTVNSSSQSPITADDCNFDIKAVNICGSFEAVTGRLTKAGYEFDWSGNINNGDYRLSLMTKGNQSFYLKTDAGNGATIIMGVGKGAYVAYEHKAPEPPQNLIARNQ